jgi:hopanoid C-3 methylase
MRILLVKPQARLASILGLQGFQLLEPLELGYLAAVVPPEHEVGVLDLRLARFPGMAFRRALARFRPDVVGLTGYTHEASGVKELARTVRRKLPRATVVVGGHHATVAPADYDIEAIDVIVRGAGCAPFAAIVARLSRGERAEGIPNVLLTGGGFDPVAAADWPQFPDPATLPFPRRDLWDPARYRAVWVTESPRNWETIFPSVAMVRTSFGCRMKCSFCIVPFLCGGRHMPRPADVVAEEIARVPARHIYFADDENFIDENFAFELAEALAARGVRKRYFAWTRSTTVNRCPELFRRWRNLGLDGAFLGFEFPSDEQLKRVKKGASVADNERAHATLRSMDIAVHAAFMVTPGCTEEDFALLAGYVRAMPPAQCSVTVCTPSPGTPSYKEIEPDIWVDNPHDLHDCMHPLTRTALPLRRFCRLFADQARLGESKTPLRAHRRPLLPQDIARVTLASRRYHAAFKSMYRDYPRDLWG